MRIFLFILVTLLAESLAQNEDENSEDVFEFNPSAFKVNSPTGQIPHRRAQFPLHHPNLPPSIKHETTGSRDEDNEELTDENDEDPFTVPSPTKAFIDMRSRHMETSTADAEERRTLKQKEATEPETAESNDEEGEEQENTHVSHEDQHNAQQDTDSQPFDESSLAGIFDGVAVASPATPHFPRIVLPASTVLMQGQRPITVQPPPNSITTSIKPILVHKVQMPETHQSEDKTHEQHDLEDEQQETEVETESEEQDQQEHAVQEEPQAKVQPKIKQTNHSEQQMEQLENEEKKPDVTNEQSTTPVELETPPPESTPAPERNETAMLKQDKKEEIKEEAKKPKSDNDNSEKPAGNDAEEARSHESEDLPSPVHRHRVHSTELALTLINMEYNDKLEMHDSGVFRKLSRQAVNQLTRLLKEILEERFIGVEVVAFEPATEGVLVRAKFETLESIDDHQHLAVMIQMAIEENENKIGQLEADPQSIRVAGVAAHSLMQSSNIGEQKSTSNFIAILIAACVAIILIVALVVIFMVNRKQNGSLNLKLPNATMETLRAPTHAPVSLMSYDNGGSTYRTVEKTMHIKDNP